ncbi:MAG: acetylglutamate kinase [Verrucomicrobiota bacterium]|nr:acetylglutamate kinase [Verrucomicrobiota bacterium]
MTVHKEFLKEHINKAGILVEALPYIQDFRGKCILVKVGGSAMEDAELLDALLRDVVLLEAVGINPVIVHGGGKAISNAMANSGIKPRFVSGQRYTDPETMSIVEDTLVNEVNPNLVSLVHSHGGKAKGIHGAEVFVSKRMKANCIDSEDDDLGLVGEVIRCQTAEVKHLTDQEIIPIVSPVSMEENSDSVLNTNADIAASSLAAEMNVAKLVYISDVLGVLRDPDDDSTLINTIKCSEVKGLSHEGIISGGMLPKLNSAIQAIESGVGKVHMIDGRIPHSLLLEIFTNTGIGTEIVPS